MLNNQRQKTTSRSSSNESNCEISDKSNERSNNGNERITTKGNIVKQQKFSVEKNQEVNAVKIKNLEKMLNNQRQKTRSRSSSVESNFEISDKSKKINTNESERIATKGFIVKRQKSSVEKHQELNAVKIEALSQLENTIKMADIIEIKNKTITELELQVKILKQDLKQCQYNLEEKKCINKELMDKLDSVSQVNSRQKIDLENIRAETLVNNILESPVSPNSSYSSYLKDIYENRERVLEENIQLLRTIDEQRKKIISLESYISRVEDSRNENYLEYKNIEESTLDERSTSDLLAIIRRHIEEKVVWMEYAIKLTQDAMKDYPQLFDVTLYKTEAGESSESCNESKCLWSKLMVCTLERIGKSSPQLLRSLLKSTDANQKKYIESKLK